MIALADLKEEDESGVKKHLIDEYDAEEEVLGGLEILVAYESNESYEASAFFLFRRFSDGTYFELHASHCSCYGFENQFENLEETNLSALKYRVDNGNVFTGCYGDDDFHNSLMTVHDYIKNL